MTLCMLVKSTHNDLQPDICIRVGQEPQPCHHCGRRAIYQFGSLIICRSCALSVQQTLNRLRESRSPEPLSIA
jgi:hypothetical protein